MLSCCGKASAVCLATMARWGVLLRRGMPGRAGTVQVLVEVLPRISHLFVRLDALGNNQLDEFISFELTWGGNGHTMTQLQLIGYAMQSSHQR